MLRFDGNPERDVCEEVDVWSYGKDEFQTTQTHTVQKITRNIQPDFFFFLAKINLIKRRSYMFLSNEWATEWTDEWKYVFLSS